MDWIDQPNDLEELNTWDELIAFNELGELNEFNELNISIVLNELNRMFWMIMNEVIELTELNASDELSALH